MAEIFGHRWTSAYGSDPHKGAGETWAKGLAGLTTADVARGVESCLTGAMAWPPTLPEFRELCLGIPTLAEVRVDFLRLRGGDPATPFLRLVWQFVDSFAYRNAGREDCERMIGDAYVAARKHRMAGGELPPPVEALPPPPKPAPPRELTPEERAERRAKAEALKAELFGGGA